ncbi:MAG: glycosyltransferase family 39 protein, partial [Chloroflexota bacterium]|nr:glycosyltransferase family 39 protein [Chloroflexota bacterium]
RLWNLESIPAGPYTDEAGRAIVARAINQGGQLIGGFPFSLFGTAWWGVPNLYFWLEGQSMKLFGDTLLGARVVHAIAGILTVWYVYRIGRAAWSPRAGLVAMALIALSDFAIQFSRTAGESTIAILTWTVCFYYLYKAIKTRRPLDFVLSGLAAGLTLYTYASGKLLPIFIALAALYLLARWGLTGFKRYLPGLALLAFTAGLTFLPNAVFIASHKPDALTERSNGVNIFSPGNQKAIFTTYGTDNWGIIVPRQFALTYAAFDVGQERGPFYPTKQPILPVPWAALWLLGTAYVVYRVGDVRYAVLAIWLLSGLAGAAVTNDTPTLQRVAGMVPTLALIPALFLDRLASGFQPGALRRPRAGRARIARQAVNFSIAAIVLGMGTMAVTYYFGPYTAEAHYLEYTLPGRYAEKLDPQRDIVYGYNLPMLFGDPSPTVFLANGLAFRDYNPSEIFPISGDPGKNIHFLFSPPDAPILGILQSYYPNGTKIDLPKPDGTPFMAAYRVDAGQLDARRVATARYGSPGGPILQRTEPRIGTLQDPNDADQARAPASITYPTAVEWESGLVAPVYGTYHVTLNAPAGAQLTIDGRTLLTGDAGGQAPSEADLVLAKGVHAVRLAGTLASRDGRVELRWGVGNQIMPVARRLLWGGPRGVLLGESYAAVNESSWYTAPDANAG